MPGQCWAAPEPALRLPTLSSPYPTAYSRARKEVLMAVEMSCGRQGYCFTAWQRSTAGGQCLAPPLRTQMNELFTLRQQHRKLNAPTP